jgi:PDZ domain-containing protein
VTEDPSSTAAGAGENVDPPVLPGAGGLSQQTMVLLVSGFASLLLISVAVLLPVPFVKLEPGPALNTLGSPDGEPLISVTGHPTYPTDGTLDLTTVTVMGGPGGHITLVDVLQGWLSPSDTVVPEKELYPSGATQEQTERENQKEMPSSQEAATAAAMSVLGIHVPTVMTIESVDPDSPVAKVLQPGDVIVGAGGTAVADLTELREVLNTVRPGQGIEIRYERDGIEHTESVTTSGTSDGRTVLGLYIDPTFTFPFTVTIQIDNIGGPSAGMMFALGIIDVLTPGPLTGGEHIAGTGTIDSYGMIGPIGGIRQKMIGARDAGAEWFLAPEDDCFEAVGHIPAGLRVVPVTDLDGALASVETIASGTGTESLPVCTR